MNKIIAVLFAGSCYACAAVSQSIMGVGQWFWVIIVLGSLVLISQFVAKLKALGAVSATLLAIIAICAVVLGLVAATIGGSFRIDDKSALLLFLFFMIALLGFTLAYLHRKSLKTFEA